MRPLGLPSKTSSCEVSAAKIKNTVKYDVNLVLERFKNYYSTLAENLVQMLPKTSKSIPLPLLLNILKIWSQVITLASTSKNPIIAILKATQVSKGADIDNFYGCFLKNGVKFLSKFITDLCNLLFPEF